MRRVVFCTTLVWASLLLLPPLAAAQGTSTGIVAGAVKDSSGAVLPGVTVEASSPALIEKTRTAVTDSTGQYKITDLRPGAYTVTFSLAGFNTSKREGIELTRSFVATVNADPKGRAMYVPSVGSAQETTITTTGGLGESETAGVVVNIISKDGGNTFRGALFGAGATSGMSSKNYDQALQDAGLKAPNTNKNVFDYEYSLGGPILKDRLWFFGQGRYHGSTNYIAGMFVNKNAGD